MFPTFEGIGHAELPTLEQLKAAVEYTHSHRTGHATAFDVVLEGQSDDQDHELLRPYREVGLTWWVEKLGWFRGPIGCAAATGIRPGRARTLGIGC